MEEQFSMPDINQKFPINGFNFQCHKAFENRQFSEQHYLTYFLFFVLYKPYYLEKYRNIYKHLDEIIFGDLYKYTVKKKMNDINFKCGLIA